MSESNLTSNVAPSTEPQPTNANNAAANSATTSSTSTTQNRGKAAPLDAAGIAAKLSELKSSSKGLSSTEAQQRLTQYGPNAIEAKEEPLWHKLFGYFWGPIPWMIEAAAIISLLRADWADFAVVMGLLIYNAAVGFWQDAKAASALAALKKDLALKARALRDGAWVSIDAAKVVPGDVVDVSGGEIVPADLLLITGDYLSVDQAALTGESLPVSKKLVIALTLDPLLNKVICRVSSPPRATTRFLVVRLN